MVVPAIATPATTPSSEGSDPKPAPAAPESKPASGAPPQSAGDEGAKPESGKGGQEPAGGGNDQKPSGDGNEQKPAASQEQQPSKPEEPRRLTEAEWQRQQAALKRQQDADKWANEAKELHSNARDIARDALDEMAEKLEVSIPTDLRKPILDLVKNLVDNAERGAELKHKEPYEELKGTLQDTSLAFLGAMDDAAMRDKFADMVRDGEPKDWVKALLDLKTPSIERKAAEKAATAQAALLPEGEVRDGFLDKVKGKSDPKVIAQAFHDALLGVVGPSGEPRVQARASNGRPTLSEVTRRRAAGEYKSDAEFLAEQNLALQGI